MPQKEEYSMGYDSYNINCKCSKCTRTREKKRDCQCKSCRKPKVRNYKTCEYSHKSEDSSDCSEKNSNSDECSTQEYDKYKREYSCCPYNKDKCKREPECDDKCKREQYCCKYDKDECKSGKIIVITIK